MWSSFDARRKDAQRSIRRGWVAVIASIVFHAVILAIPSRDRTLEQAIGGTTKSPMSVVIVNAPTPAPTPLPTPIQAPETPKEPAPQPKAPRVAATSPRPSPAAPQQAPAAQAPQAIPSPTAPPQPAMDMAALIAARRAQRQTNEHDALAYAQRRDQGPLLPRSSADQAIQRNLGSLAQGSEGTSGVFQILRKGQRTAEFAFNGWKPDSSKRWRQVIEVDAGIGGDVELALVRGMIKIIREHYQGDFNWQSYKQGKVITLSARQQDNEKLEDFLSTEFFGTPVLRRDRTTTRPAPPG